MDARNSEDQIRSRTRDIGRFEAPVLVCGGAYSNLEALEALMAAAGRLGIRPDHIIHTGDVVAYCADPKRNGSAAAGKRRARHSGER